MSDQEIETVIHREVNRWKNTSAFGVESAKKLNNGYCKQFAKGVKDAFGDEITIREHNYGDGYSSFAHVWIEYENSHHDAECPEGVEHPKDLPFFDRNGINPQSGRD